MNRRTARGNRIGLAAVGAVLLLAGTVVPLRGLDLMPDLLGPADEPVTSRSTRDFAVEQDWFWPVLAAALIVLALLALRWLLVQARTDAFGSVRLESDPSRGATRVPARTVTGAVVDDLGRSPYLRRVRAELTGSPAAHPHLNLAVGVQPGADPDGVRQRVHEALDRCRRALESEVPTTVHLRR